MSTDVLNNNEHHNIDYGEDSQHGNILEEVNSLGEAERQDEED